MPILQGFEEVNITAPITKMTMTVMDTRVRFNKATAIALGYPAYVKVLVNEKTKQVALEVCTGRDANAVKFSKPEGKQTASVSLKDATLVATIREFFTLKPVPEGEDSYAAVPGKLFPEQHVVVFDAAGAVAGTMKRRGRKKVVKD